jgi:hypothetical protein
MKILSKTFIAEISIILFDDSELEIDESVIKTKKLYQFLPIIKYKHF